MEIELTDALLKQIDDYIKGTLTNAERLVFEKKMEENTALKEEVALQHELITFIGLEKWITFSDNRQYEDLKTLKEQFRSKTFHDTSKKVRQIGLDSYKEKVQKTKKSKRPFYYIPAVAAILLLISVFVMSPNSGLAPYYDDYVNWEKELPSFTVKNSGISHFYKGEIAFRNKKYKEALAHFNSVKEGEELYPYSLMYKGAAYELVNQNNKALKAFDKLIVLGEFEEHTKGYWYKLLIYLKLNEKEKVEEISNKILNNEKNYNYKETLQLISKIKT